MKYVNGEKVPTRKCRSCTICCTYLRVEAKDKPELEGFPKEEGVPCKYLGPGGCSIYETRPAECAHFWCGYLTEITDLKPSISGWMFVYQADDPDPETGREKRPYLTAWTTEARYGRVKNGNVPSKVIRELRRSIKRTGKAVIATPGRRTILIWDQNPEVAKNAWMWCQKWGLKCDTIYQGAGLQHLLGEKPW